MSRATFDDKFGETLVSDAPTTPGVYRYLGADGEVLYVGKAKNLKRRLSNYRNATRKKAHRKMRILVREADSVVYEACASEAAALLREGELIRTLRPSYNVDGAFAFLYPSLGWGEWDKHTLLCFTTQHEEFSHLNLRWHGSFRSRPRVKEAFDALVRLLSFIAHREKAARLPSYPRLRGSRLVGLRQVPREVAQALPAFFAGEHSSLPRHIARLLLAKPKALREASGVQEDLRLLMRFYEADAVRLREALLRLDKPGTFVCQDERDALFIHASVQT